MILVSPLEFTIKSFLGHLTCGPKLTYEGFITQKEFNDRMVVYNVQCMSTSRSQTGWITGNLLMMVHSMSSLDEEDSGWSLSEVESWTHKIFYDPINTRYYVQIPGPHMIDLRCKED